MEKSRLASPRRIRCRMVGKTAMDINYDKQKITVALKDFCIATGIQAQLLKPDFSLACDHGVPEIGYCKTLQSADSGKKACCMSDEILLRKSRSSGKTEMSICHGGLLNVVIPLLQDNVIIGYIIFGGMKPGRDFPFSDDSVSQFSPLSEEMQKLYDIIPAYDYEKIQSICNVAVMLGKYILLKNMLKPHLPDTIKRAVDYINSNLDTELSIAVISRNANISKSVLYKSFHRHFGCTVSEYIKTRRVNKAKELISFGEFSVEEISQKVGFSSASYFSRTFKSYTGMSPTVFKKDRNGI